ncbi:MAG: PAS domain S-box protein [Burkholderiales bacterium]|nr:PAS domain S-box protein [Burkholderiales bacterium]
MSLFSDDGFVIVRSPFELRFLDMNISKSPVLANLRKQHEEGSFEDASFLDDKNPSPKLYTYRKINGFPVTTVFARDFERILAPWHKRSVDRLLFSGATIIFIMILTYFLLVHIRRLHRSESTLRDSQAKFVNLFQRSPVPLALMSLKDDQFLEVNDALLAQSGFERNEVIGHTAQYLHSWSDPNEHQRFTELLLKKQVIDRFEAHLQHKNGEIHICQISARLLHSGDTLDDADAALPNDTTMVLFSPIDITRQREIEDQIRELNQELEERVSQRTNNLINANEELEDALLSLQSMQSELLRAEKMAALGSLVAGVAHELNTPIGNSVTVATTLQLSSIEILEEVRTGQARRSSLDKHLEACVKGAEILMRNLQRAAELVSSFKQVAVDQTSSQQREFDLKQALEDVVVTLEPLYKKTQYKLHLDLAENIQMNSFPGPLGQIITNFITNAIAHAFEGREAGNMWLSTHLQDEDHVEIIFRDDGVGIAKPDQERVFDPFFTTKLGQGGSGLGMHIVYNLVNGVLGGKISLKSNAEQGTTITMEIPRHAAQYADDFLP